jgi:hypothetical protein
MWQRRTFHECASELRQISEQFRAAYTNARGWDEATRDHMLHETSKRGVEVLRILALSIRSDQDYGFTQAGLDTVGAFRAGVSAADAAMAIQTYRPPYTALPGYSPLRLRQALNKVAHANPSQCGFYADDSTHDLVLTGEDRGSSWVAVVSIAHLCAVIESLPDVAIARGDVGTG